MLRILSGVRHVSLYAQLRNPTRAAGPASSKQFIGLPDLLIQFMVFL